MPLREIASGARRSTGSPKSRTLPFLAGRKPMTLFMQVVLPAPLRPRSASTLPSPSANDTECSTWLSPWSASTSSRASAVAVSLIPKVNLTGFGIGHHFGARPFDDDPPVVQHGDAIGHVERGVHVVLDHHHCGLARHAVDQALHLRALLARQAGERLVEQQHARLLRERHGDLDAALFTVCHLRYGPPRYAFQPDAGQHLARFLVKMGRKAAEGVPLWSRKPQKRQRDVVLERVLREERDDLVGAREAAVHAVVGREPADLFAEQLDGARIAREVAGEEIEERGLASAVRADDEPPFPGLNTQGNIGDRGQAAERLLQVLDT